MNYEEIMLEIKSNLCGEAEIDLIYLQEQLRKYKEHESSEELLWGIGRLIFEVLPEEQKQELSQTLVDNSQILSAVLEEAQDEIAQQNYDRGITLLESLVEKIDATTPRYEGDKENEYLCFDNLLEEVLYRQLYKTGKNIRLVPHEYADTYLVYGNLLLEMGRYKEARKALLKSKRWNPIKVETLFELGEIYKANQQFKRYLEVNLKALSQAYTALKLARCYRNLGYYYVEKEKYELATALYSFSVRYDRESNIARAALQYISHKTGERVIPPSFERCGELFAENGIQFGPNELLLNIAVSLGDQARDAQVFEEAGYYYSIAYELTGDPQVKKWIDALPVGESH